MPPKKQTTQRTVGEVEEFFELVPDQGGAVTEATSSSITEPTGAKMECLSRMLESFMQSQKDREARLEMEAQRQEHRWRALQHQFGQLQAEVQRERLECQALGGMPAQAISSSSLLQNTDFPNLRDHRRQSSLQGDDVVQSPVPSQAAEPPHWMGWQGPKMLPLQEDDDIEHYLTTFEQIAQTCRWPVQYWTLHLVPLLSGKARAAYVAMELTDTFMYDKVKKSNSGQV